MLIREANLVGTFVTITVNISICNDIYYYLIDTL